MESSKRKSVSQDEILMQQYNINLLSQINEDFYIANNRHQKYYIQTFGCQMNEHDSENIAGMFEMMNIDLAESLETADIIIFNTCISRLKYSFSINTLKE